MVLLSCYCAAAKLFSFAFPWPLCDKHVLSIVIKSLLVNFVCEMKYFHLMSLTGRLAQSFYLYVPGAQLVNRRTAPAFFAVGATSFSA